MLRALEDMPDEAIVQCIVASRPLTQPEQRELVTKVNHWGRSWSSLYSGLCASATQVLLDGWVVVWAAGWTEDEQSRQTEVPLILGGSDLNRLLRLQDLFEARHSPPVRLSFGNGFIVDGEVRSMDPRDGRLRELIFAGGITNDTLVFNPCPVSKWRAGRFIHRVGDDPGWYQILRPYMLPHDA